MNKTYYFAISADATLMGELKVSAASLKDAQEKLEEFISEYEGESAERWLARHGNAYDLKPPHADKNPFKIQEWEPLP